MNTAFFLMAQYNAQVVIPVDKVVKDYFPHLSPDKFVRKVSMGDINIPMIRIEGTTQRARRACTSWIWPTTSTHGGRQRSKKPSSWRVPHRREHQRLRCTGAAALPRQP